MILSTARSLDGFITGRHDDAENPGRGGRPAPPGRGLAIAAAREVCELAAVAYGLTSPWAPLHRHGGSQAVLTRAGFVPSGEVDVGGVHELRFVRDLTVDGAASPADR